MSRKSWTADEVKMAIVLYCKLPFGQLHSRHPEVMALAQLLERSAGSVAMKLCNLASRDPAITATGRKGLDGASALDREVWAQFAANWDALATQAEWLLRDKQAALGIAEVADVEPAPDVPPDYSAETRRVLTEGQRRPRSQGAQYLELFIPDGVGLRVDGRLHADCA